MFNKRKIIYAVIIAICVIAVIMALIFQITGNKKVSNEQNNVSNEDHVNITTDYDAIKEEFNNLFDNKLYKDENDYSNLVKYKQEEDFVFTYKLEQKNDNKYDININIPLINIQGYELSKLNETTNSMFILKANEIITSSKAYTVYNIEYTANITNNILSIAIKSTIKEGENAQRIQIQTYSFDLKNQKNLTAYDIFTKENIDIVDAEKMIKTGITEINQLAQALNNSGYSAYKRDLTSSIYTVSKTENFYVDKTGRIYAIYAYGNQNYTSEYDVIAF